MQGETSSLIADEIIIVQSSVLPFFGVGRVMSSHRAVCTNYGPHRGYFHGRMVEGVWKGRG